MIKRIILFSILFILQITVYAGDKIEGQITTIDGIPVQNVKIASLSVDELTFTISDAQGRFVLDVKNKSDVKVRLSYASDIADPDGSYITINDVYLYQQILNSSDDNDQCGLRLRKLMGSVGCSINAEPSRNLLDMLRYSLGTFAIPDCMQELVFSTCSSKEPIGSYKLTTKDQDFFQVFVQRKGDYDESSFRTLSETRSELLIKEIADPEKLSYEFYITESPVAIDLSFDISNELEPYDSDDRELVLSDGTFQMADPIFDGKVMKVAGFLSSLIDKPYRPEQYLFKINFKYNGTDRLPMNPIQLREVSENKIFGFNELGSTELVLKEKPEIVRAEEALEGQQFKDMRIGRGNIEIDVEGIESSTNNINFSLYSVSGDRLFYVEGIQTTGTHDHTFTYDTDLYEISNRVILGSLRVGNKIIDTKKNITALFIR